MKVKGKWKLGRIESRIVGNDGVIRGYKLHTGNGYVIERQIQLIQDFDIDGEETKDDEGKRQLNPTANEVVSKRRMAKDEARSRMTGLQLNEDEEEEEEN